MNSSNFWAVESNLSKKSEVLEIDENQRKTHFQMTRKRKNALAAGVFGISAWFFNCYLLSMSPSYSKFHERRSIFCTVSWNENITKYKKIMGKWNLDIFYKNVDCGQTVWSRSLIFLRHLLKYLAQQHLNFYLNWLKFTIVIKGIQLSQVKKIDN